MPDINHIEVPSIPARDVDVLGEYQRVREGLTRFKRELADAGDTLLADQIKLEKPDEIHVRYNPSDPRAMPSVEPLSLDVDMMFLYGFNRGGGETAMIGLEDYCLSLDKGLTRSRFVKYQNDDRPTWTGRQPTTPDLFNGALRGLKRQHLELEADRLAHSAQRVVVPSLVEE